MTNWTPTSRSSNFVNCSYNTISRRIRLEAAFCLNYLLFLVQQLFRHLKRNFACFRTIVKRQIWPDCRNRNSWLPSMRNAEDIVVYVHATESIATQWTGLIESLFKIVTFLLCIDQPDMLINKLCFLLFYAVCDKDRMNTFNFPWSHFRHFLQLMTTFWGKVYTVKKYWEKHSCLFSIYFKTF